MRFFHDLSGELDALVADGDVGSRPSDELRHLIPQLVTERTTHDLWPEVVPELVELEVTVLHPLATTGW